MFCLNQKYDELLNLLEAHGHVFFMELKRDQISLHKPVSSMLVNIFMESIASR